MDPTSPRSHMNGVICVASLCSHAPVCLPCCHVYLYRPASYFFILKQLARGQYNQGPSDPSGTKFRLIGRARALDPEPCFRLARIDRVWSCGGSRFAPCCRQFTPQDPCSLSALPHDDSRKECPLRWVTQPLTNYISLV